MSNYTQYGRKTKIIPNESNLCNPEIVRSFMKVKLIICIISIQGYCIPSGVSRMRSTSKIVYLCHYPECHNISKNHKHQLEHLDACLLNMPHAHHKKPFQLVVHQYKHLGSSAVESLWWNSDSKKWTKNLKKYLTWNLLQVPWFGLS